MAQSLRIAIVGGGIIGLTTALKVKETLPESIVIVFSDEYSPYTTGDVSAGYWEPYMFYGSSYEENRILKWSKIAYDRFLKEARSLNANILGVQAIGSYNISDESEMDPFWSKNVLNYNRLNNEDLRRLGFEFAKFGYHFTTTTVDVKKYLPHLMSVLENNGVKFIKSKIKSFDELTIPDLSSCFHYVINCTGLGAKDLCQDVNLFSKRGQVLRAEAPWIKECISYEQSNKQPTYIIPNVDCVVLGGTIEDNAYKTEINKDDVKEIFNRCKRLMPSLQNAKIIQATAGLRPARIGGIRLEMEIVENENGVLKVIHNYGHGGSGVTLSWGCANEVLEILLKDSNMST